MKDFYTVLPLFKGYHVARMQWDDKNSIYAIHSLPGVTFVYPSDAMDSAIAKAKLFKRKAYPIEECPYPLSAKRGNNIMTELEKYLQDRAQSIELYYEQRTGEIP